MPGFEEISDMKTNATVQIIQKQCDHVVNDFNLFIHNIIDIYRCIFQS